MSAFHIFSRRTVLLSSLALGAAAGTSYLFTANHTIPPADAAAEKRFCDLQDAMLVRYGVPAVSRFLDIDDPRLRVHVIEAGQGEPLLFIHGGNSVAASWVPLRRSRLIGQLPGRKKLKTGSRLLVSRFPEIKFILSCCGVL